MCSIIDFSSSAKSFQYFSGNRKIFSYKSNTTASIDVGSILNLKTAVKEHAELRIQLFYIKALAVWQKSVRTEGSPAKPLVWVGRARTQGGRSKVRGVHAAHADANAGLTDNRRTSILEELLVEQQITPVKKRMLQTIGFTKKDMEDIQEWIDGTTLPKKLLLDELQDRFYKLDRLFQARWPHLSIIEGSQVEVTASATTALPRALNLHCDKPLELATRPKAALLYKKCMQGELSPRKICIQYVKLVQTHFSIAKRNLSDSMRLFDQFTLHAKKNFLRESVEMQISFRFNRDLKKVQALWTRLHTPKLGVPNMILPLSERYFVRGGSGAKREKMLSRLATLRKRKVTLDGLKIEWERHKELLQELLHYATWEKEGSVLPNIRLLVRYTSPRSKKVRTPNKEEALELSWSLIQPAPKNPTTSRTSRRLSLTHC